MGKQQIPKYELYIHVREFGEKIEMRKVATSPTQILAILFAHPPLDSSYTLISSAGNLLTSITIRNSSDHRNYIAGIVAELSGTVTLNKKTHYE